MCRFRTPPLPMGFPAISTEMWAAEREGPPPIITDAAAGRGALGAGAGPALLGAGAAAFGSSFFGSSFLGSSFLGSSLISTPQKALQGSQKSGILREREIK